MEDKRRIYNRNYKLKNKEKILKQNREYYHKNKEIISKKTKIYREKNKKIISDKKKKIRIEKRNNIPYSRPEPKEYSENEILNFVKQYKEREEKFWCPLTNKIYKTYGIWVGIFATKMTKKCVNRLVFLLQEPHYSKYSGILLSEEEFSYSETYKGWTGFKKYTLSEIGKRVWTKINDTSKFKTPEYKKKISEKMKTFFQTERGLQIREEKSKKMLDFFKTEEGKTHKRECSKKNSISMKKLIQEGKFTPPITNTWTHWESHIKLDNGVLRKFRSSWEACFYYSNRHMLYENIRVKELEKTYVSDFFDENTNTMYEIKPRNRYNIEINKMTALQNYCIQNNIKFVWINESNILDYIDVDNLSKDVDNIGQLHKMIQDPTIKKQYDFKYVKN